MPYIVPEARVDFLDALESINPETPGELNFVITKLIDEYMGGDCNYGVFNTVIGVLECAKLELYRRILAPYEDKKKDQNGDVYTV